MNQKSLITAAFTAAISVSPVLADGNTADVLMDEQKGCMTGPIEQFGRYIGDWDIADQSLNREDGTTWLPGNGARWNFVCVGNGIAVQDFWMPNGAEGGPAPGVGTNLRIYDAKENRWDIAWTATGTPGFSHIRAKEDENGNIVMHYVAPEQNPPRRITFFPPTDAGWDWTMEMSFDGGTNWTTVYKIKATLRE